MIVHYYAGEDADMKHLCGHADTPPSEQGGCCSHHWHKVTCDECLKLKEKFGRIVAESEDETDCLHCDLEALEDPQAHEIKDLKLRLNQMSINFHFLLEHLNKCSDLLNINGTWQQRAERLHDAILENLEKPNG